MESVKVIIEVRNGNLQAVYSNTHLQFALVNFDKLEIGKDPVEYARSADIVTSSLNDIYGGNETGRKIKKRLKQIKF